jgi:hypothetical protein
VDLLIRIEQYAGVSGNASEDSVRCDPFGYLVCPIISTYWYFGRDPT